jgi:glycosyltransferase involved in cell wall biosynthesis
MKVSICMITYGHENYIAQAIEGVLMQETNFDFELIVSNDSSPDATDKVVRSIVDNHPNGNRIRYYGHEKNIGMMPNFIFAIQQCQGKYIALCEGDDYWIDPYKLQKQVDFLEANPDYVLSFHKVNILKPNGEVVDDFITKVPENYETIETLARLGNYIHTPSVVFRNIIKEFPPEFSLTPIGDYFLYMLLAEHGKLKYLEEKMSVYREGVGIWSTKSIEVRHFNTAKMNALLYNYFINKENKLISMLLDLKIKNYFYDLNKDNDFHDQSSIVEIKAILYEGLLMNNEHLSKESVYNVTFKILVKNVLLRIKRKLWK